MTRRDSNSNPLLGKIVQGLESLRLKAMSEALDAALASPTENEDRLTWLWRLLEPQVRAREEGRVERRFREAKLPERKTLEGFNFSFQPSLDRNLVMDLATLRFIEQGRNVLLAGMSGTGKSHIALALGLLACVANYRVRYTTNAEMLSTLQASMAINGLPETIKLYTRPQLLILDEVGLEQVEKECSCRSGLMQKVLFPRYKERLSTIITSNIPWDSWGTYLDDHLGAMAILDRLIHHSHCIVINGPSYRDWTHRQQTVDAPNTVEN